MTDRYCVIGQPVAHSLSPRIHLAFAQQVGHPIDYTAQSVSMDQVSQFISSCHHQGIKGCNVTLPLKQAVFAMCDELDPYAEQSAAVSYCRFEGGRIIGGNLDGMGLVWDLQRRQNFDFLGKHILVLGTGGAVHNVLPALLEQTPASITVAYRTEASAQALADRHSSLLLAPYEQLTAGFDLIINGTSASLQGNVPPVPSSVIEEGVLCYDMMYDLTDKTDFLSWCSQQGAVHCSDGLGMLIEQNAEIFYQWRGVPVDTQPVYQLFGRA